MKINPDEIELTEREERVAIQSALLGKKAFIRNIQFKHRIAQRPSFQKYTSDQLWSYFKKLVGEHFEMTKYNQHHIDALCYYFAGEKEFEKMGGDFSLQKGICLQGPYGCGKSTILSAFQTNQHMSYRIVSVLDIDDHYEKGGIQAIEQYYGHSSLPAEATTMFGQQEGGWLFDDVGQEEGVKAHFANRVNVVDTIFKRRYTKHIPYNRTHMTTNFNAKELSQLYPFMASSGRFSEMFNFLPFDKDAPNYRKK